MTTRDGRIEAERRAEFRSYIVGLVLAAALTGIAFSAVAVPDLSTATRLWIIGAAALAQIVVHFRFFLHIGLGRSTRDDLQLILFTVLIIALMVGGTIWIMGHLHMRMM